MEQVVVGSKIGRNYKAMWLSGFLLFSMAFAAERELTIGNYRVRIDKGTLKSIEMTNKNGSNELKLTGLRIKKFDEGVFENTIDLTHLDLANNSIRKLNNNVFAKLTKLEYLSLAENPLRNRGFSSPFADLQNLKILNLTNNRHLTHFKRHYFYGLSSSCKIITRGINIDEINTAAFKDSSYVGARNSESADDENDLSDYYDSLESQCSGRLTGYISVRGNQGTVDYNTRIKICIENGTVMSLEVLKIGENLTIGCKEVEILRPGELHMRAMGITGFSKGWYKLHQLPITNIDFQDNDIVRITRELANDLPASVRVLALQKNKIERVESGIIENDYLSAFVLRSNRLNFIEDGAFEKLTKIENIFLDYNRLTNMEFAASLPLSIEQLYLAHNEITDIRPGILSRYNKLFNLQLQNNKITKLKSRSLRGLSSLEHLRLENNRIVTIESGFSQNLRSLIVFDASNNRITDIEAGAFTGLQKICSINLQYNKLRHFPKSAMTGLPTETLENLLLDHNDIERLETGSFINVPTNILTLQHNRINSIERGTFNLPKITALSLNDNLLTEFNGDAFQGLPKLKSLMLGNNRIATFKNAGRNLGNLDALHIENNLFHSLENGSLFGVRISRFTDIHVRGTPIHVIHGGIFEEMSIE